MCVIHLQATELFIALRLHSLKSQFFWVAAGIEVQSAAQARTLGETEGKLPLVREYGFEGYRCMRHEQELTLTLSLGQSDPIKSTHWLAIFSLLSRVHNVCQPFPRTTWLALLEKK